jgi:hypothetical protein
VNRALVSRICGDLSGASYEPTTPTARAAVHSTATPHRLITSQGCLGVRRRRPLFGIVAAQTPLKAWLEPIPQCAGRIHSWVHHERDLATYSFERLDASQSYLDAHNCLSRRASRRRRAAAAINLSPFRTRPPGPNRACRSHSWPLSPVDGSASCGADHTHTMVC